MHLFGTSSTFHEKKKKKPEYIIAHVLKFYFKLKLILTFSASTDVKQSMHVVVERLVHSVSVTNSWLIR